MKKILIIYTGGTIGMIQDPITSHLLPFDFNRLLDEIPELNKLLKEYANKANVVYLDYYSAMVDSRNGLPKKYSEDGVHPSLEGYKVMEPLVKEAIVEALQ